MSFVKRSLLTQAVASLAMTAMLILGVSGNAFAANAELSGGTASAPQSIATTNTVTTTAVSFGQMLQMVLQNSSFHIRCLFS